MFDFISNSLPSGLKLGIEVYASNNTIFSTLVSSNASIKGLTTASKAITILLPVKFKKYFNSSTDVLGWTILAIAPILFNA